MKNISRSSVVMYSFAGFGQNMLYAMMITYLIDFYSLKLGAIAGIIMFVARVLDALKDPIVGNYIDAHKSRYGKLRHFYIILPIPLALLTVLLFLIPDIGLVGKAIYCLIIFFLWGCCYTLSDLAYLGSSSAMSENVGERNKLISVSRLFCTLGGALPTLIVPLILSGTIFNLSNTTAYIISALVFGIAGSALFALGFPSAKEVIVPECKKVSFKGSIKIIKQNKPLLLILIATLLGSVRTIVQAMGIIIAKVNFGSADYFTYMAIAFGASLAIGTLLVPVLLKKLSFKKLYIYSSIIGFILQIVFYFVGYSNFYVVLFMLFLTGLPFGIYNTLAFTIPVDCIDYLEWKTGKRYEGVCFSLQTFQGKVASGMVLGLGALAAFLAGYTESATYTTQLKDNLFTIVTILPAIGCALCILPMLFYNYDGENRKQIQSELAVMRENAQNLDEVVSLSKEEL